MNFVFVSPHFPKTYWNFCERLHRNGVNVLGIGDAPFDEIPCQLMSGLSGLKTQFQQIWTDLQGITKTAVGGMSDEVKQDFADMKDSSITVRSTGWNPTTNIGWKWMPRCEPTLT